MPPRRRQWENLLNALENESCILLLGPSISTLSGTSIPLNQQFANELTIELKVEGVAYDEAESNDLAYIMQRFTTITGVMPSDPGFEAKAFYERHGKTANALQKKLATLPFPLIVNTSPDALIARALKEAGKYQTQFEYYNFRKHREVSISRPSVASPLVYNLFGYYADAKSLVLTEEDQVVFTTNVVRDTPPLPTGLLGLFDPYKTYLFLGFDWEQWPLRLLLRSLNLEKETHLLSPASSRYELHPRTRDFYESQFHLSFITENIEEFVQNLKKELGGRQQKEALPKRRLAYIVAADEDDHFRSQVAKALQPLPIAIQHRGSIEPGADTLRRPRQELKEAEFIFLLVSSGFLADSRILKEELPLALEQQEAGNAHIIPIIIRPCHWEQVESLTSIPLILPKLGKQVGFPVSQWESRDEALRQITAEVSALLSIS